MADVHFAKSCAYPNGWDEDASKYLDPPNINDFDNMTFIKEGAQNDPQGYWQNDTRGISMGVIGHIGSLKDIPIGDAEHWGIIH